MTERDHTWRDRETKPDRAPLGEVKPEVERLLTMTGYVGKYGRKDSSKERTILIRRLMHRGRVVTNHQWFICGDWSFGLRKWDVVRIISTGVSIYKRGYRKGRNGESYQLNKPVEASVVLPPECVAEYIATIDNTMVAYGMYDHGLVFDVLRGRVGIYTEFQRHILQSVPELDSYDVGEIMRYMTDRVSQYGSLSIAKRAISKLVNRK